MNPKKKLPGVYDFFDEGGLLSAAFDGFEFRQGQLDMSLLVQKAYETNSIAVIEAGTGIGKSFAYLVPAMINARKKEDGEKTVVATATKNLQLQLSKKDIPQLFSASDEDCRTALLFGRSNYICLRRLEEISRDMGLFAGDTDTPVGAFLAFVKESETGLFSDYPNRLPDDIRANACSDGDLCYGHRCPFVRDCFYYKAKREASKADIIITNHHLLFTDAAYRDEGELEYDVDGILPPFSRLVIDEAHNIEQNATDLFSGVYSGYEVTKQIANLLRPKLGSTESRLDTLSKYCLDEALVQSIRDQANFLNTHMATLDLFLAGVLSQRNATSLLLENPQSEGLVQFYPLADNVAKEAGELVKKLRLFSKSLKYSDDQQMMVDEYDTFVSRIESSFDVLSEFADKDHWTGDVHFIRETRIRRERVFEICISPLSVAQKLRDGIFSKLKTVICTSATLNLNDDFGYWSSRVGVDVQDPRTLRLQIPSPFDYEHNLLLLTPFDAPEFKEATSEVFQEYASSTIFSAVSSSNGGALILFTSYRMMNSVFLELKEPLEKQGFKCLVQGSYDRFHLLKDFKEDPDSVLFATSSFWEGVDAPGNTLRMVIIVKLPFQAPTEPILKARTRKIESDGGSGFFNLALPEATMKLKQGYGRLIRNKSDKGIVLILDSRVITKNYGQFMIHALPHSYQPETSTEGLSDKIENFLYQN